MRYDTAPIGTLHAHARCCWCGARLAIVEGGGLRFWVCPDQPCYQRQLRYAVVRREQGADRLYHVPLPSQVVLYESAARGGYVLWGGQAGPGKSVGSRWWLYHRSLTIEGHEALLLRENWDQLRDNHMLKMEHEVPALGGRWLKEDRLAIFGKGSAQSIIHCGHMAEASALEKYHGIEYGAIVADEASRYPLDGTGTPVLAEVSTRARRDYVDRSGAEVKGVCVFPTNPGGPSAAWLKDMCIDHQPDLEKYPALAPVVVDGAVVSGYDPALWSYIPAMVESNPYQREHYRQTTLAVLEGTRYKQLAEGDWYASAGQFFTEWNERFHVMAASVAQEA